MHNVTSSRGRIARCVMGVAVVLFVCGPLAPARADSVEDTLAQLEKKAEAVKSLHQVTKTVSEAKESRRETIRHHWMQREGSTVRARDEITVKSTGTANGKPSSQETKSVSVCDGKALWNEMRLGENLTVLKSEPVSTPPLAVVRDAIKRGEAKLREPQTVDGVRCAVVEIVSKNRKNESRSTYWISEEHGLLLKSEMIQPDGQKTEMITTEVQVNESVPADKFAYAAPAGANVIDMSKLGGGDEKKPDAPKP